MRPSDRGSASVWLLAVGLVITVVALAGAALGAAQVTTHRAQTAADMGALAGAARAAHGRSAACARAAELAAANGGRLARCDLAGLELTVTVAVDRPAVLGPGPAVRASARAGPVRAPAE